MQKKTLPQKIIADWERCAPVLNEFRWWLLLNWMACRPDEWHSVRRINEIRGLGYKSNENAADALLRMTRKGILVREFNPKTSLAHTFLYTLSPASRRLMGVDESIPPIP